MKIFSISVAKHADDISRTNVNLVPGSNSLKFFQTLLPFQNII